MRAVWVSILLGTVAVCGCSRSNNTAQANDSASASTVQPQPSAASSSISATGQSIGFDRNDYPGDDTMIALRKDFVFTSYWLTTPPGDDTNTWAGKRELLKQQGWGFLVLANGKLEAEILKARKAGTSPANLARKDAVVAIAAAKSEQFPARTIVFLDQEEGGRLTDVQAEYLLAWTEAVGASDFRPGVYASGQRVQDDPGVWIDTVQDIRDRVKKGGLHEVAIFDTQDECPPAPGCTLQAKPLSAAGEPDLVAWQYSQSPRRPTITKSCAKTYAADGNCYAPGFPKVFLDMDVANSPDPSHGR